MFLSVDAQEPNGLVWRETALAAYEATVQRFLQRLCVLIRISGGQSVHVSEFFEMTWRDTQRRRSIIIRHDRVMVHVKYHTGQQQTGKYKENVRFLAHPVGELSINYHIYAISLHQIFQHRGSTKAILLPFLQEKDGKVWAKGQLSRYLEHTSTRACIPRPQVANWRHITVVIVKSKFASQIASVEAADDDEDAEEVDGAVRIMTKQPNDRAQIVD
jgi:hypothetical protein